MIAKVDEDNVLITNAGRIGDGRYQHPSKSKVFSFDHLRRTVEDIEVGAFKRKLISKKIDLFQ